ncbi:MAG: thioredoxin [bacterium]|nr:thioredoxin [bacterium]
MIKEIKNENFDTEIKDELVLVDFYASWCGPCKMMHPVIAQLAEINPHLKILKVNVDEREDIARDYGIMTIPTLILFKNNEIKEKNIGFTPRNVLEKWIENHKDN